MKFRKISLSGGGTKGFCQLGALKFCHDNELLKDIHTYAGTSIGSAIVVLLCAGYTPDDIYGYFFTIDLMPNPKNINPTYLLTRMGLIDSDVFAEELRILLKKKMDCVPTMKSFYEYTKKDLYISSVNITKANLVYFNHSSHPDLDVVEAVKMSCNLPLIFTKLEYNGDTYVDGGLVSHTPFEAIDNGDGQILNIVTSGLGMELTAFGELPNYIYQTITVSIKLLENLQKRNASDLCWFLNINTEDIPVFNVVLSKEDKDKLWMKGYTAASEWYQQENMKCFDDWGWDESQINWKEEKNEKEDENNE